MPADGTTLDDFKRAVGAKLAAEWGAPNAARLEIIFRTNVEAAYNAGRFAELNRPAMRAVRPFWKYVAILDGRTTATCAPLQGAILRSPRVFPTRTHMAPNRSVQAKTLSQSTSHLVSLRLASKPSLLNAVPAVDLRPALTP